MVSRFQGPSDHFEGGCAWLRVEKPQLLPPLGLVPGAREESSV